MAAHPLPSRLERDYDFELERVARWVSSGEFRRVLIQSAPGLTHYLGDVRRWLEAETGASVVVDGRGRFGGCDVHASPPGVGVDAVVHFGHTGFVDVGYPILYVPCHSRLSLEPVYEMVSSILTGFPTVGLEASVQHVKTLPGLRAFLEARGKRVLVGEPGRRGAYPGQVVGCDYYAGIRVDPRVDAHVVVSGGVFHSLGLALSVDKPVLHVEPYTRRVEWVPRSEVDRVNRVRGYAAYTLMNARRVAVVDTPILGQHTDGVAEDVAKLIREKNHSEDVDVFSVEVFSNEFLIHLKEMGYEVAVTSACTRFATDDYDRSPLPVFEAREVMRLYRSGLNVDRGVVMLQ